MRGPFNELERRRFVKFLLFAALGGCDLERMGRVEGENAVLQGRVHTLTEQQELTQLRLDELEAEQRRISSKLNCNDEKVRDFLRACEEDSVGCSESAIASSLNYLRNQDYTLMYLRPAKGIDSVQKFRQTQLEAYAEPYQLLPSTRFLVITLPRSYSIEHQTEADRIGRQVIRYLRSEIRIPANHPILGPKRLPCKLKREQLLQFKRRRDQRQIGEPYEGEPTVIILVIRTDC